MIEFPRIDRETVGKGHHRSGWPFVLNRLIRAMPHVNKRVLFDDFIERSFSYDPIKTPYTEAWGGILHHPPEMPDFAVEKDRWETIFNCEEWIMSFPAMKFAIFTTEYQERHFSAIYPDVPTFVALHPTDTEVPMWSPDAHRLSHPRRLIQIGSYLRDTRAIYRVPGIDGFTKIRLLPGIKWLRKFDRELFRRQSESCAKMHSPVVTLRRVDDHRYDFLLSNSIVLSIPINASACNVVVECIARCTPLITVKIPPLIEYLGEDYPLYVTEEELCSSEKMKDILYRRIYDAYEYMKCIDKAFLDVNEYARSICDFVGSVV